MPLVCTFYYIGGYCLGIGILAGLGFGLYYGFRWNWKIFVGSVLIFTYLISAAYCYEERSVWPWKRMKRF